MKRVFEEIYAPSSMDLNDRTQDSPEPMTWRMISDQVMGGKSQGQVLRMQQNESVCDCLQGDVSLENNGGFIQMQMNFKKVTSLSRPLTEYDGIFIELMGKPHVYNLHFKSSQLWLPWQSFRKEVMVTDQWQRFFVPFSEFEGHRTFSTFKPAKVTRFAIVAIGEAFQAKVCVRRFGVYRNN